MIQCRRTFSEQSGIEATACAGGGVVDAFLSAGKWKVRAVTRNSGSEKAKALDARGVEVVEANLSDSASLTKVRVTTCLISSIVKKLKDRGKNK